jgi:UDP-N-acetylmuramoyl-tripeptide--D-alanyl-D-alanine ligase
VVGFSTEKQDGIVDRLMDEVPFTSYSIGSKTTVFNNLMNYGKFLNNLVPTETVASAGNVLKQINKYKRIVLKPSCGCQGVDVYFIVKMKKGYEIIAGDKRSILSSDELIRFVTDKLTAQTYIVQPYIHCRTSLGYPYDIRLHVQKNKQGGWTLVKAYPRMSVNGGIVCNIHGGGCTADLDIFLKKEYESEYTQIKANLEEFALTLAAHMDKIQNELYGEALDELGIDVGLDENRRLYVYEINWRPGYPPSMNADLNPVKNLIHYAMFLARNVDKGHKP